MAKHCDHIHDIFDGEKKGIPILSCLGALNDNYKGGEFILFDNKQVELKAGELLIFPSNFMYPHEIKPVTKGTRYSYISWVY
jgi:predicted 2-oxoglutarate/Fe(II)-dependent dioxygenase YbiX